MKVRSLVQGSVIVAGCVVFGLAARAEPVCSPGFAPTSTFGPDSKPGRPFAATFRVSHHQVLANGNSVDTYADFHLARNSVGSTRYETPQRCFVKPTGAHALAFTVTQYDAPTDTRESWTVNGAVLGWDEKVLYVEHEGQHGEHETPARPRPPQAPSQARQVSEDLGLHTIAGIEAHGHRITTIVPAAEAGSKEDVHIRREFWYSDSLGTTVRMEQDDPREGQDTFELKELLEGEPPPGTFDTPVGALKKPVQHM